MKYGWTVSNISGSKSINKTRQISSRNNKPVIELSTAKVDKIHEEPHYIPRLADFPDLEDRRLIFEYLTHLHPDEEHSFPHNKTRGLPPILPANWEHHNLGAFPKNYILKPKKKQKKVSHEDIFGKSDSDTESESDSEMSGGKLKRHKKGSPEAKAWGQRMREARMAKMKGGALSISNNSPQSNAIRVSPYQNF